MFSIHTEIQTAFIYFEERIQKVLFLDYYGR